MVCAFESVPALMVAVTANDAEPAGVAVPDIAPVEEFNTSPAGGEPVVTANVIGLVPAAVTLAEYAVPTVAPGSEEVVIDGTSVYVNPPVLVAVPPRVDTTTSTAPAACAALVTRFTMLVHLPREEGYRHKETPNNGPALAGYGAMASI